MTGLEYVLAAVFAAVWLVPLTMAVHWERRLRTARRTLPVPSTTPGRPAQAPCVTDRPARTGPR